MRYNNLYKNASEVLCGEMGSCKDRYVTFTSRQSHLAGIWARFRMGLGSLFTWPLSAGKIAKPTTAGTYDPLAHRMQE
jgi:hypothetical protein